MRRKLFNSSRRYQDALRKQMKQGKQASLASARGVGSQALPPGCRRWIWPSSMSRRWWPNCCRAVRPASARR